MSFNLNKDYYKAKMIGKNISFQRILLIKNDGHWSWKGVLHEFITSSHPVQGELLEGVINEHNLVAGFRSSDPDKWRKDITILHAALKKEPNNTRYVFYLAQTYAASGQLEQALEQYERRISMEEENKTCPEEFFWSLYSIGCLQSDLKRPHQVVIDSFLKAFFFDKTRAEPLYRLAIQFQIMESYILGYVVLQWALKLPFPEKAPRIQHSVYDYLMSLKLAELSLKIGKQEEGTSLYQALLHHPKVPLESKKNIESILKHLVNKP
ncbi:MAG: hypothetical protein Q8L98_04270 [Chlamydiales bacterium]|nr:hypothetical protein [Chlamydiales bacterium]